MKYRSLSQFDTIQHNHSTVHPQYRWLKIMCEIQARYSNTCTKLLEVSYGKTPQHNTGLLTISSLVVSHSALYGVPHTHWEHAHHGGFWNFDAEHWTDTPLDQPPGTTMETDEDEDRLTLRRNKPAAPLQLMTSQSETQNLILSSSHATCWLLSAWSCSSFQFPRSSRWATQSLLFLNLLSDKCRSRTMENDSPHRSSQMVWDEVHKKLGSMALTEQHLSFFAPDSSLCPKYVLFIVL